MMETKLAAMIRQSTASNPETQPAAMLEDTVDVLVEAARTARLKAAR